MENQYSQETDMLFAYKIIITILMSIIIIFTFKDKGMKMTIDRLSSENINLSYQVNQTEKEKNTYMYLYNDQEKEIIEYKKLKTNYEKTKNELENLKSQIYLSKEREKNVSRGDYIYKDLSNYEIMTVDELNKWIDERAPKDSPFRGRGADFLAISASYNKDPKYIVAHAATESKWGKSNIAQVKGNYFGITAYNNSPTESAKSFDGGFKSNISDGIGWINTNFFKIGRTSLYAMQYNGHGKAYAQNADGSANEEWINTILGIIYK